MLNDYLLKLIDDNKVKIEDAERELSSLMALYEDNKHQIEVIEHEKSLDVNIFSPRNIDVNAQSKIDDARRSNEQVNQEIEHVRNKIENLLEQKNEYLSLIDEHNKKSAIKTDKELPFHNFFDSVDENDIQNDSTGELQGENLLPNHIEKNNSDPQYKEVLLSVYHKLEKCVDLVIDDPDQCIEEIFLALNMIDDVLV